MRKPRILFIVTLTTLLFGMSSCNKVYVDIDCSDVQVCVSNIGNDTIYFTFNGETHYPPEYPETLPPGETLCHGYGPFKEYGKDGLLKQEYEISGTNAAIIETMNETYYISFDECNESLSIIE